MQMIIIRSTMIIGLISLLSLALVGTTYAHNGVDHSKPEDSTAELEVRKELLRRIIALLEHAKEHNIQLAVMGTHQASHEADHSLHITAEVHNDQTHIHVYQSGKDEVNFFLEGIAITDQAAVITAVAKETGLDEHDIEDAISFLKEKAMHDDHSDDEHLLVHIMADGSVMDSEGQEVHGAIVLPDGKIKLTDGSIVEPEFDLR